MDLGMAKFTVASVYANPPRIRVNTSVVISLRDRGLRSKGCGWHRRCSRDGGCFGPSAANLHRRTDQSDQVLPPPQATWLGLLETTHPRSDLQLASRCSLVFNEWTWSNHIIERFAGFRAACWQIAPVGRGNRRFDHAVYSGRTDSGSGRVLTISSPAVSVTM